MKGREATLLVAALLLACAVAARWRNRAVQRAVQRGGGVGEGDSSLGRPGEGVHQHVGGVAAADLVLSLLGAAGLSCVSRGPLVLWIVVVLSAGEVLHAAYGVPTATQRFLFGRAEGKRPDRGA